MGTEDEITLKVFRFDPSSDEWPRYDIYHVPYQKHMRVLDALNYVYDELEMAWPTAGLWGEEVWRMQHDRERPSHDVVLGASRRRHDL